MFVVPSTLASPADFHAWTGLAAPANLDEVLRACSGLVLDATSGARYPVDEETGLSTDNDVKNALRDATCIQAAAWVKLGIDPDLGGTVTQTAKKRKKVGSAEIEYADSGAAAGARAQALTGLVPAAEKYLRVRGLISGRVSHT